MNTWVVIPSLNAVCDLTFFSGCRESRSVFVCFFSTHNSKENLAWCLPTDNFCGVCYVPQLHNISVRHKCSQSAISGCILSDLPRCLRYKAGVAITPANEARVLIRFLHAQLSWLSLWLYFDNIITSPSLHPGLAGMYTLNSYLSLLEYFNWNMSYFRCDRKK